MKRRCTGLWRAVWICCLVALVLNPSASRGQQKMEPPPQEFNLTAAGDSLFMNSASVRQNDRAFMGVVKAIQEGDARFVNVEEVFPGPNTPAAATSGNGWIGADPSVFKELQWMGFNLFGLANNQTFDWGQQGVLDTIQTIRENGGVYAGAGRSLGEARQPGYLLTPRGRIALIDCTSTFGEDAQAGDPRSDGIPGRPGVSMLHHSTVYQVDAAGFEAIKKIKTQLNLVSSGGIRRTYPSLGLESSAQTISLPTGASEGNPISFELADKPGVVTRSDPIDLAEITHSIRGAKILANYVVTSIHSHEGPPGTDSGRLPAQFLIEFAHAAVDAGTDVFIGHGPHQLRGIEIYKGRVIFYSLGDLWFQNRLVRTWPSDFYRMYGLGPESNPADALPARLYLDSVGNPHKAVIARVLFRDGRPSEVFLTPYTIVTSPLGKDPDTYGTPRLAEGDTARQILEYLETLSAPFGTRIEISNGVGHIIINVLSVQR
jgi:poly-gamma-glutamate capsule biosynthesis protein CapA/YwtB (metallophosphatase superfamily)